MEQGRVQTSHCFLAKFKEQKGSPTFTEKEIESGMEVIWVTIDKAINLLKTDKPISYSGKFTVKRDLLYLEKAKEMINSQ